MTYNMGMGEGGKKRGVDIVFHLVGGRRVLKVVTAAAQWCQLGSGGRGPGPVTHP